MGTHRETGSKHIRRYVQKEYTSMQSRSSMTILAVMAMAMLTASSAVFAQEIPPTSIAGTAISVEELSTLVDAVVLQSERRTSEDQLDLLAALSNPEDAFTVFAPVNDAFAAAFAQFGLSGLNETDQDLGYFILTNHVVPGAVAASDLSDGQVLEALSGLPLTVEIIDGQVFIMATDSTAQVLVTDVPAGNSFVHVVDTVLLPFSPSDLLPSPAPESDTDDESIADVAVSEPELSILVAAIVEAGLLDAIADPAAELTVFAPINQAFVDLLESLGASGLEDIDADTLVEVLTYHVVPAVAFSTDLSDGQVLPTLDGDSTLTVDIVGDEIFIVGTGSTAEVIVANVEAGNSVVHVVNAVLLPFSTEVSEPAPEPEPETEESIADVAVATPSLSILVEAVVAGGLLDAIADPAAELTVFAPTNEAFADLLEDLGASSLEDIDTDTLVEVLTYHVVPAVAFSTDLSDGQVLPTLNGAELVVDLTDGVVIDGIGSDATVILANVAAGNSVVHVVDAVLLPFGGDDSDDSEGSCVVAYFPCGPIDDGSTCCSGICRGSFFFFPFYRFCSPF